ncbi:MAG: hypothetical protein AABY86_09780, partial [Bdellovibrionota bacterium]
MRNSSGCLFASILRQAVALLLCSVLLMHNDYFVGQAFADADPRLADCQNQANAEMNEGGERCSVETVNYDHQDIIISEGYYSMLVLWVAALVAILQLKKCLQGGNCGWSTLFTSVAGLALLAGEILQIAMYSEAQDKIEYRPDMLRKYKDSCGSGSGSASPPPTGEDGSEVGAIDGVSICSQYAALVAQKKSYEKAKQAAEYKFYLQIAAAAAFAIAAIIEYVAATSLTTEVTTLMTEGGATIVANSAAAAECTVGAAACSAQSQACNA